MPFDGPFEGSPKGVRYGVPVPEWWSEMKDYQPSTNEWIDKNGRRVRIDKMSDDHLENTIHFLRATRAGRTEACLAMEQERTRRRRECRTVGDGMDPFKKATARERERTQRLANYTQARKDQPVPIGIDAAVPPESLWGFTPTELDQWFNGKYEEGRNAMKNLFQVAILRDTTTDGVGTDTELLYGPSNILATSSETAKLTAVAELARTEKDLDVSKLRIIVRAFQ